MTTALRVTQAYKRFGATQALNGAEVVLERGQLLLLLGPNGAGKTTLIRAVAGRVRLDQGEIEVLGENLEIFGAFHGLGGAALAEQVKSALTWTALADRADEPIKRFSGGMKRRLN